ncbi:MAG: hypothetical protein DI628_07365 [Blastochloris viridis]|uniref:Flagellar hook-length control protein FliK n=1 Tax=Blastochloris viridis TaxID=1079 RepID=A0A6N4QZL2_BLAVI|nr:MAG: hypothetical protein DI628_07365 [Blastochloris viridis]
MNLLDALPSLLSRLTGTAGNVAVSITFTPQLPPDVRQQILNQNPTQPFTLTVAEGKGNTLTFTAANGQTFQATVNPPLPTGTRLQLSPADVLLNQSPTTPIALQAKILPTPTTGTSGATAVITQPATPAAPQPQPTPPPYPVLQMSAEATSPQALSTAISNALAQQQPVLQPTTPGQPVPLPVPAGPVAVIQPNTLPQNLFNQLLTLLPTAPMKADGTQPAVLQPADTPTVPLPNSRPTGTPIALNLGVELKPNQPQPAIILPPAATPATPQSTVQPTLVLTGPSTAAPQLPTQPIALANAPTVPQITDAPEVAPTPVAARILPPQPGQPATQQTALLASGATVTLTSQQPLPTGSIVIMPDIPLNPSAAVQRVLAPDSQSQQQPNTNLQGNQTPATAAPTAPQMKTAVLAPGMVVQGTITGQNEQGQPLLTLTAPPPMAGQQAALNLTNPTALLPMGAGLTIRVDNSLAATILGLTLPAQTQAAYTVGTIGARWENLQQGLHALQQQSPQMAERLRASLPQLSNMLPGLIAFTNALRTNDPEKALDREAARILKAMGIDLSSDISQLSQLQQRPSPQADHQWRGTLFPYVEAPGEDPRQGGFFWRREKKDDPRAPTSTRFVVEVDMSNMGALQLDGLVTYPDIWLKLRRTSQPEEGFTENLQAMVTSLLQSYGLNGGIAVETTATFPVNPRAELLAETDNPLPTSA